ncbi:MAG: xanthine dehydrogenase family protein molybdopterin-binding subunit, partial [Deltaproteobacteria bacterium]|nr:xanthine dehydrogenase family protein molybdopterin-binding subunit [Deltaproteobacteria bacterium]
ALFMHGAGFTGSGEKNIAPKAALKLHSDCTVEILVANTEMGQGAMTALSRIVANALSIPLSRVRYPLPETSRVPNSGPTVASRTTMIIGRTLELCAADLLKAERGKEAVFERQYDFPPDQVWDEKTYTGSAYAVFSWGAVAVEVEIVMATIEVAPKEMWLAYEIGRAVNPAAARGQLEGGTIQALGYGLLEKMDIKNGGYLQDRLQTYIIPTSADVPEIHTRIIEIPYSRGPGGAKGIGELPMNGMAAAVRNAVRHALGIAINSIPVTPEKILECLRRRDA